MKVYFDNVDFSAEHAGPNCFAKRLAIQFGKMGITVADPDDYDVGLVFIEPTAKLNFKKPFVQRVDGMWFRPDQYKAGMNRNIEWAHRNADVVVYQSDFDRQMLTKWLGTPKKSVTIRNGVDLQPANLRSESLIEIRKRFDKVFVCSANWHAQKRLKDNIELFRHIRATLHPNSCLIVLGNNPEHVSDRGIFYAGSIRHDLCAEVYSIADWMLHLAWLDHCPNVVVEAIAQGCPVICASEGGTKELVQGGNGLVIDEVPYDFSLVDYDRPPRVPVTSLAELPEGFRADPKSVDIVKTAEKYAEALQSALNAPR